MEEISNKKILDYLLGKISEKDEPDFLAKCFESDENAEKYEMVRDNLIENYLKGNLTVEDMQRFKTHFLKEPYHKELFDFSKTIRGHLKENQELAQLAAEQDKAERKDFFSLSGWLVPAMCVLLLLVGLFTVIIVTNQKSEIAEITPPETPPTKSPEVIEPVNSETNSPSPETNRAPPTPAKTPSATPVQPQRTIVTFILSIGTKGNADEETLKIYKETKQINLKTPKPVLEFQTYRAVIKDKAGQIVFSKEFSKFTKTGTGTQILISVPANVFRDGEHTFILEGKKEDRSFEELKGTKREFVVSKEQ